MEANEVANRGQVPVSKGGPGAVSAACMRVGGKWVGMQGWVRPIHRGTARVTLTYVSDGVARVS